MNQFSAIVICSRNVRSEILWPVWGEHVMFCWVKRIWLSLCKQAEMPNRGVPSKAWWPFNIIINSTKVQSLFLLYWMAQYEVDVQINGPWTQSYLPPPLPPPSHRLTSLLYVTEGCMIQQRLSRLKTAPNSTAEGIDSITCSLQTNSLMLTTLLCILGALYLAPTLRRLPSNLQCETLSAKESVILRDVPSCQVRWSQKYVRWQEQVSCCMVTKWNAQRQFVIFT